MKSEKFSFNQHLEFHYRVELRSSEEEFDSDISFSNSGDFMNDPKYHNMYLQHYRNAINGSMQPMSVEEFIRWMDEPSYGPAATKAFEHITHPIDLGLQTSWNLLSIN